MRRIENEDLEIRFWDNNESLEYFKRLKKGEDVRKEIIDGNLGLVVYNVKYRYGDLDKWFDDLVSVGVIGLIKSVDSFNASMRINFISYANRYINGEIRQFLKKENSYYVRLCYGEDFLDSEELGVEDRAIRRLEYYRVRKFMTSLQNREYDFMTSYYGLDGKDACSQTEIGKKLGIDSSLVSKAINSGIVKVRKKILFDNSREYFPVKK